MPSLVEYVGMRIRDLRNDYASGAGISQDALAKELGTTGNTISRWETGTYKPTLEDLDRLARFFGASILSFFPPEESQSNERLTNLLRAAKQLNDADLDELQRYAEFRRARSLYAGASRPAAGRKRASKGDAN